MSEFAPCPSCRRHVRARSEGCPFCGARLDLAAQARRVVPGVDPRLSRAAALVAVSLAACSDPPKTPDSQAGPAGTTAPTVTATATATTAPTTAPTASTVPVDPGYPPIVPPAALYGAAPMIPMPPPTPAPTGSAGPRPGDPGMARPLYGLPPARR